MRSILLVFMWVMAVGSPQLKAQQQQVLPKNLRTNGRDTLRAFESTVVPVRPSLVSIFSEGQPLARGTIIDSKGHFLTKASEVRGKKDLEVILFNQEKAVPLLLSVDQKTDLALMKIEGKKVNPITRWGTAKKINLGNWVLSPGKDKEDMRMGILSANRRSIEREGGVIGVILGLEEKKGVRINSLVENGGAKLAGIEVGDIITGVNGKYTQKLDELKEAIRAYEPGDKVTVTYLREEKENEVAIVLGYRADVFNMLTMNHRISGKTSRWRSGFEEVLQHDTPLSSHEVGGPLLNEQGEVIGLNIARVDRVTTFALPANVVQKAMADLLAQSKE